MPSSRRLAEKHKSPALGIVRLPGACLARKSEADPHPGLQEFEIGVILDTEQFNVRRVLLADSLTAPTSERRS